MCLFFMTLKQHKPLLEVILAFFFTQFFRQISNVDLQKETHILKRKSIPFYHMTKKYLLNIFPTQKKNLRLCKKRSFPTLFNFIFLFDLSFSHSLYFRTKMNDSDLGTLGTRKTTPLNLLIFREMRAGLWESLGCRN